MRQDGGPSARSCGAAVFDEKTGNIYFLGRYVMRTGYGSARETAGAGARRIPHQGVSAWMAATAGERNSGSVEEGDMGGRQSAAGRFQAWTDQLRMDGERSSSFDGLAGLVILRSFHASADNSS